MYRPQKGPQLTAVKAAAIPELFYGGARGGGKSFFLVYDFLMDADNPDWHGIIFRKTISALEQIQVECQRIFPHYGGRYARGARTWYFPSGATLKLRPLEHDADADKYQGHQYTWIGWDELTQWPTARPYQLLTACLRSSSPNVQNLRIRATGNPGGPGHNWVKNRFVDPAPSGSKLINRNSEEGIPRIFIKSKVQDNKVLLKQDPNYIKRLQQVGSPEQVKAWLDGDWNALIGAYFDLPERLIIKPFDIPEHWTRIRAYDDGLGAPFSVNWIAMASEDHYHDGTIIKKGAAVVYREWYGWNGTPNQGLRLNTEEIAQGIRERDKHEQIDISVADPSIRSGKSTGPSVQEVFLHNDVVFRLADNNRLAGWQQIRIRMKNDMLYIFDTCAHLIRTLPVLQYDKSKVDDLDSSGEDHAADSLRYGLMTRPWTTPAPVNSNETHQMTFSQLLGDDREDWIEYD